MRDMIAAGAEWFDQQRREHLSVYVTYRRRGAVSVDTVPATIGMSRWDSVDSSGQIARYETRDYLVGVIDLEAPPAVGDRITEVGADGTARVYEVTAVGGNNHWQWADRGQRIRRIHTTQVA